MRGLFLYRMGNFRTSFNLQAQSGSARSGLLRTGHGAIKTPIFMPVGTRATVRGVDTRTLSECVGFSDVDGKCVSFVFTSGDGCHSGFGGFT